MRANGLSWQRTTDAIGAFVRQSGSHAPRRALFCTFEFDVNRFEAVVLPALVRRGQQFRTLVAIDAGALQGQLRNLGGGRLGRYQVAPVRVPKGGVFHPKLIFLAAGAKRLVGIGSANLTSGGLGGNLELMLFADDASEEGRQLVGGAARFLDRLIASGATQMPASAREFIQTTLAGIPRASNAVLDSLDVALLEQMARIHLLAASGQATRNLIVLSPWHSSGASATGVSPPVLRALNRSFKPAQMAVFTEGQNDRGPALGRGIAVHIRTDATSFASTEDGAEEDALERAADRRPARVHAKAYLAEINTGSGILFFGSANCTQPALMRSVSDRGNVELLVASMLDQRAVAAMRADLNDLFKPARRTAAIEPASAAAKTAGAILAGTIVSSRCGLELEAPSIRRGDVYVSREPKGPRVRVQVRSGLGRVQDAAHLSRLFEAEHPSRESGNWGCVLWERLGTGATPFPVSVPLLVSGGDSPESVLRDLVWEELGLWPRDSDEGECSEDTSDTPTDDPDDLDALAAAEHEGQLDRIAVSIAILRRKIIRSRAGRDYTKERMELLRRQVARLDLPSHIRNVLLEYLGSAHRNGAARA